MIGREITSKTIITNTKAKEILEEIEKTYTKRDKSIGYELEQSIKYVKKFSKSKPSEEEKLASALKKLDLPDNVVVELLNVRPKNPATIKAILTKKVKFDDDKVSKILDILA